MQTSLAGQRALVCGASQGIGRACAEALAAQGAAVTMLARTVEKLEDVKAQLPEGDHHCLQVDLADWQSAGEQVAKHIDETGPINILVHNCGGPKAGPASEAAPEAFLAGLTPHVLGGQSLVQAVLPGMRSSG
ncbi:MAG: SDR family NAD(P)-dependent oxidoreductase, partial [Phycisphaerales bacterium]|nr:SDR family NAD(P)-dependent oxidoreductase [Phycisphaerales bacterium]